MLARSTK